MTIVSPLRTCVEQCLRTTRHQAEGLSVGEEPVGELHSWVSNTTWVGFPMYFLRPWEL